MPLENSESAPRKDRILVADDNKDSADSLAMVLSLMGNDVRTAYDGNSAVEVAASFEPDVVLLDIIMPKLNGFDAARRIRQHPHGQDALLVAMTGWDNDEDIMHCKAAGFDLHMVKPLDPSALEQVIIEHRRELRSKN